MARTFKLGRITIGLVFSIATLGAVHLMNMPISADIRGMGCFLAVAFSASAAYFLADSLVDPTGTERKKRSQFSTFTY